VDHTEMQDVSEGYPEVDKKQICGWLGQKGQERCLDLANGSSYRISY